jgi:uncharacterized protein YraI
MERRPSDVEFGASAGVVARCWRRLPAVLGLALALLFLPTAARAQAALTTTAVTLRAGPSTDYPQVLVLPTAAPVTVYGCLDGWSWCDVSFQAYRGWVYGAYLSYPYQGNNVPILGFGATLGLPIISFSLGDYWGRYYQGRPWYGRRDYWLRHPPPPRPGPGGYHPPHRPRPPIGHRPGAAPGPRPPSHHQPGRPGAGQRPPGNHQPGRPGAGHKPPGNHQPGRPGGGAKPPAGTRPGGQRPPNGNGQN